MTMVYDWKTGYCEYDFVATANPNQGQGRAEGQVKVTTLHWTCSAYDDAVTSHPPQTSYGTVDGSEQDRVYTLPALSNVPQHVMTKWVHDAMGADEVKNIEDNLLARWQEELTPTSGGFTPKGDVEVT